MVAEWFATRYHAPSDDVGQPIDRQAADRFNELMVRLTIRIANAEQRPTWNSGSFFRRFTGRGEPTMGAAALSWRAQAGRSCWQGR